MNKMVMYDGKVVFALCLGFVFLGYWINELLFIVKKHYKEVDE